MMRAVTHDHYCSTSELVVRDDLPVPQPADDEVLVRVVAASLHADVWHAINGVPAFMRLMGNGVRRPKPDRRTPGTDFAGIIEAVGAGVTTLQVGEEVLGESIRSHQWMNGGAFAEHVVAPAERVVRKSARISFEQAATIPTVGLVATDVLLAQGRLGDDERVLINGAGGALGTFCIQLARSRGAHVTAVDAASKLELLASLGAHETIDYRTTDFADLPGAPYDLIIDIPGGRPWRRIKPLLTDAGRYVFVGHDGYGSTNGRWLGAMRQMLPLLMRAPFTPHLTGVSRAAPVRERLELLVELAEAGTLTPVIDSVYGLDDVSEAFRRLEGQEAPGRVVLRCDGPATDDRPGP